MVGTDSPPDPLATPPRVDDPRRVTTAEVAEWWAHFDREDRATIARLIEEGCESQTRTQNALRAAQGRVMQRREEAR